MVGPIRRKPVPTVCEGVYGKDGPNPLLVRRCADKWNTCYFRCWEPLLLQFFSCSFSSLDELNDLPQ